MFKMIVTDAVVSKGYEGAPAIQVMENGKGLRFRIGKRVYDSRAAENIRWVNLGVKAFGDVSERIKKMKLDAGSYVHIVGRYDEDSWTDSQTNQVVRAPVLIVDEIEYAYSGSNGNGKQNNTGNQASNEMPPKYDPQNGQPPSSPQNSGASNGTPDGMPENFTGYESFGGGQNPFFPDDE